MAICEEEVLRCPKCGEIIVMNVYKKINAQLDPAQKELLLKDKIYEYECPSCHCVGKRNFPLNYVDLNKGVMIHGGTYEGIIYDVEKCREYEEEGKTNMYGRKFKHIGAPVTNDLAEKIVCIDNDLDYRFICIYDAINLKEIEDKYKDTEDEEIMEPVESKLQVDSLTNKLSFSIIVGNRKTRETTRSTIDFSMEKYNEIKSQNEEFLNKYYLPYFSANTAKGLELIKMLEEKTNTKPQKFLIVHDIMLDRLCYLPIPSMDKEEYEEGDRIVFERCNKDVENEPAFSSGEIIKTVSMSTTEMRLNFGLLNKIEKYYPLFKIDFEQCMDITSYDDELNSDNILTALKNIAKDERKSNNYNLDELLQTKVALCYKSNDEDEEFEPLNVVTFGKERNICIYLNKDEINKNKAGEKNYAFISLELALKTALCCIGRYSGVVINPYENRIELSMGQIFRLLADRILNTDNNFKDFLQKLSASEKLFIGKETFDLVSQINFEGLESWDEIEKATGKNKEEAKKRLSEFYNKVDIVIRMNYIF